MIGEQLSILVCSWAWWTCRSRCQPLLCGSVRNSECWPALNPRSCRLWTVRPVRRERRRTAFPSHVAMASVRADAGGWWARWARRAGTVDDLGADGVRASLAVAVGREAAGGAGGGQEDRGRPQRLPRRRRCVTSGKTAWSEEFSLGPARLGSARAPQGTSALVSALPHGPPGTPQGLPGSPRRT